MNRENDTIISSSDRWTQVFSKVAKTLEHYFGDRNWPKNDLFHKQFRELPNSQGRGWIPVKYLMQTKRIEECSKAWEALRHAQTDNSNNQGNNADRQFQKLVNKAITNCNLIELSGNGKYLRRKVLNTALLETLRIQIETMMLQNENGENNEYQKQFNRPPDPQVQAILDQADENGFIPLALFAEHDNFVNIKESSKFERGKYSFLEALSFSVKYSRRVDLNEDLTAIARRRQVNSDQYKGRNFVISVNKKPKKEGEAPLQENGTASPSREREIVLTRGELRVLTFNCLADKFASSDIFPWCDSPDLSWSRRRVKILEKIKHYKPDVFGLQEIQKNHGPWFASQLCKMNYAGHFAARQPNTNKDELGLLLGWKESRYHVVKKVILSFNDLRRMCKPENQYKYDKNHVALVVVLKPIYPGANPYARLVVATTHISANYLRVEVQLNQVTFMLREVSNLIKTMLEARELPRTPAVVLMGDFNSTPGSLAHRLIVEGELPQSHVFPGEPFPVPSHDMKFRSAYNSALGTEPKFTTFTLNRRFPNSNHLPGFKGTLDYIFHSKVLKVVSVVEPLRSNVAQIERALPSSREPSDHICLVADFDMN